MTFAFLLIGAIAIFFAVLNFATTRHYASTAEAVNGPLHFRLDMPATSFSEGADVPVELTVRNLGKENALLKFDQELEFDVAVKRDVNLLLATVPFDVWRYSASHPGGTKPHNRVLRPGEKLTYRVAWPQVDANGSTVPAGRYVIVGTLNLIGSKQSLELRGGAQRR